MHSLLENRGDIVAIANHINRSNWILTANAGRVIATLTLPMVYAAFALLALDLFESGLSASLGERSLAALGFTVPVVNALFAVIVGLSIGLVTRLTQALGRNDTGLAKNLVSSGLFVAGAIGLGLGGLVYLSLDPLFGILGVQDSRVFSLAHDYLSVRCLGLAFWVLPMVSIGIFRATGNVRVAAVVLCSWSAATMALDWIAVAQIQSSGEIHFQAEGGLVRLAWAHVYSDVVFSVVCIFILNKYEGLLVLPAQFARNVKDIMAIAIPASFNNLLTPIAAIYLTHLVADYGFGAVGVWGIAMRLEPLVLLLPMALTMSVTVFAGQNWAANLSDRVKGSVLTCMWLIIIVQFFIAVVLSLFSDSLSRLFTDCYAVHGLLVCFLRIVPFSYGALGVCILTTSILCSIGFAKSALVFNLKRLFMLSIPSVFLLNMLFGIEGVYFGMALGNLLAGAVAYGQVKLLNSASEKAYISTIHNSNT